jgi:hypothetical protein
VRRIHNHPAVPRRSRASGELIMARAVLLLVGLCLAAPALALRCGAGVVSEGDSTYELLTTCGEPTLLERTERQVPYQVYDYVYRQYVTAYASVPVEIWTYNFGPQRFVQRITIDDGRIKRIESLGYGH